MADPANPLLSTKASDSNLSASIHPLVLLTVSDQITRHQLRGQEGPIVGALLGQQKGREITAEYAFPCKVIEDTTGQWLLDQEWMEARIQQFKDVHKAPALEVSGLYTLCPESGPTPALAGLQKQAVTLYNDSCILLTFHPAAITSESASNANGKLPISVYEGVIEADLTKEDGSMQVDGDDTLGLKFRPIPYTVDTDETEMIAINYVAKGAGSAAAVIDGPLSFPGVEKKAKKKADAVAETSLLINETQSCTSALTTEEADQIAGLTTRMNSVKMLQSRLALLSKFIQSQSESYLTNPSAPLDESSPNPAHLPHLRNIQALLTRLSLLTPAESSTSGSDKLISASLAQNNDVTLSSLLAMLGQDVQGMSELGRKFATVDSARVSKGKGKGTGFSHDAFGSMNMDDHDGRIGGFSMAGGLLV